MESWILQKMSQAVSTLKPRISSAAALDFLEHNFAPDVRSLAPIGEGETSQVFTFLSNGSEFVMRVNASIYGFVKDQYAHEHLSFGGIPVPKILQLGRFDKELNFSITEKAMGKNITHFEDDEIHKFIPDLIKTFDAIHNVDISSKIMYGIWDMNGRATSVSWKNYLLNFLEYYNQYAHKTHEGVLLELGVVQKLLTRCKQLICYCPNIRHLVHADIAFNLLSDGEKITAVVDWAHSMYGDFLCDVALLSLWIDKTDFTDVFREHYENKFIPVENYHERILCYQLHFGLSALRYFSNSNQENKYKWTKGRLLELLG
jgi:hygromycin-B 4-O-kinase